MNLWLCYFSVHLIVAGLSLHTKQHSIADRKQRATHMNRRVWGLGGSILMLQMVWVCFTKASGEKPIETEKKNIWHFQKLLGSWSEELSSYITDSLPPIRSVGERYCQQSLLVSLTLTEASLDMSGHEWPSLLFFQWNILSSSDAMAAMLTFLEPYM